VLEALMASGTRGPRSRIIVSVTSIGRVQVAARSPGTPDSSGPRARPRGGL